MYQSCGVEWIEFHSSANTFSSCSSRRQATTSIQNSFIQKRLRRFFMFGTHEAHCNAALKKLFLEKAKFASSKEDAKQLISLLQTNTGAQGENFQSDNNYPHNKNSSLLLIIFGTLISHMA
jgi:hypothetical protein